MTLHRHATHKAGFSKTGLRNGSIQEKFDRRGVGECVCFLSAHLFPPPPMHSLGFPSFPAESTAVIIAEMLQEFCFAPMLVLSKTREFRSLSQPLQLFFTSGTKSHVGH